MPAGSFLFAAHHMNLQVWPDDVLLAASGAWFGQDRDEDRSRCGLVDWFVWVLVTFPGEKPSCGSDQRCCQQNIEG